MSNPIRPDFKTEWFSLVLLVMFGFTAFFFNFNLPAQVPIHWNWQGQVDGYGSRSLAAWLLPFMALFIYIMLLVLPKFDPKPDNYLSFRKPYHYFKDLILSFLFVIYLMTNLSGLGYSVNIALYLPLVVGALFVSLGAFMEKIKPNWFMGIRTPWTLSSESVWTATHRLGAMLFALAGILMAATVLFPPLGKTILFVLAITQLVIVLPIYSYRLFKKEQKAKTQAS